MKNSRGILPAILCIALCLSMLAGCSRAPKTAVGASSASGSEPITLTVWFSDIQASESALPEEEWNINKFARRFEQENPGVTVNIVYQADQSVAQSKLKAEVAAGTAPDIVNTYSGFLVTSYKDIFADITQYVPASDLEELTGWSGVRENMDPEGAILGYPEAGSELGMFLYNKELVANAGVDLSGEGAPKNAEEFKAALIKIRDAGIQPIIADNGGFNSLWMFATGAWWTQMSGSARVMSNSTAKTSFSDDENFIKTLDFTASLYAEGLVNEDYSSCPDALQKFYNGEGAMFPTGNWDVAASLEAMGDNLGIYCIPSFDGKVDDIQIGGVGQSWSVLKSCKNPEMAVKFLSYVNSKEYVIAQAAFTGKVPQRKNLTAEEIGWAGSDVYETILKYSDGVVIWNDNALQVDVANEYYTRTGMVIIGQITAAECAQQLDEIAADAAN